MDPFSSSTKLRHLDPDTPYTLYVWALTSKGQGQVFYIEETTLEATGTLLPKTLSVSHSPCRAVNISLQCFWFFSPHLDKHLPSISPSVTAMTGPSFLLFQCPYLAKLLFVELFITTALNHTHLNQYAPHFITLPLCRLLWEFDYQTMPFVSIFSYSLLLVY